MCTLNGFVTTHSRSNFWYDPLQTQKCSTIFEESSNCLAEPLRSWYRHDVYGPENQQTGKCSLKHSGKTHQMLLQSMPSGMWFPFSKMLELVGRSQLQIKFLLIMCGALRLYRHGWWSKLSWAYNSFSYHDLSFHIFWISSVYMSALPKLPSASNSWIVSV
jgi:hypothetical protein